MVKFSDLEKGNLNQKKSQEKESGERRQPSGLSFRDLEKDTRRTTLSKGSLPKEASEEERRAIYDTAADYLTGVLDAVRKRQRFALEPGQEIIRRIIESPASEDPLLIRAIYQDNPHGFLVNHCVNVTVFAIKMAAVLGLGKLEQEQIGLAALLHEVGMGVIPEKLIYKERKLDEQEYAIFKKRPEFAYKILKGFGDAYAFLAETALQVHECMDGSGYPMGLSGDEILLYAQIIGLVDMYEAMVHTRPQRDKILHFAAVKQIIKTGKRRYPKKHLKALLNIFSIFPLYSFVKLNSNAVGRVIQTYPEQPMRPMIEVVFDSQGRRVLARHVVALSENSILYIVDSVSEKDIAGLAEGPGGKPYSQTQAPAPHGHESAVMLDIDDIDGESFPGAGILEITEDDFEPLPPATGKDAAETDQSTFILRPMEVEKGEDEFIAEPVQISDPEKGRWIRRYKWVLLAVGSVILMGVLLWQLGLMDFASKHTDGPGIVVKPSGKTVAKTDDRKVPEVQTQPATATVKGLSPLPQKQAPSKNPPALAAGLTAAEMKTSATRKEPFTDNARSEVAAGTAPAVDAPAAVKARRETYPFSIKLDSFQTAKQAQSALPSYRAKGINAYWVKANLGSQGIWYRIFAGSYQNGEEAAAVISRFGLKNAVVKETKYATLIGKFSSQTAVDHKLKLLSDKGYSTYLIQGRDRTLFLFVGAFYTRKGAEAQQADLLSDGIQSKIVER